MDQGAIQFDEPELQGGKPREMAFIHSVEQCVDCPAGTSCAVGSAEATPCAPGTINPSPKAEVCTNCVAGKFQPTAGQTECDYCTPGYYCSDGAAAALPWSQDVWPSSD